jgi:hypothetical protein
MLPVIVISLLHTAAIIKSLTHVIGLLRRHPPLILYLLFVLIFYLIYVKNFFPSLIKRLLKPLPVINEIFCVSNAVIRFPQVALEGHNHPV